MRETEKVRGTEIEIERVRGGAAERRKLNNSQLLGATAER